MNNLERFFISMLGIVMLLAAFLAVTAALSGCGQAKASGTVTVQEIAGPSSSTCFIIYDGSNAVGGNCIR